MSLVLRRAGHKDMALVLSFIRELAEYEKLLSEVVATETDLAAALLSETPKAFCEIAEWKGEPVGFALWFYNFSTFRGRHGIYLEDLYVRPSHRGLGIGKALLKDLARRCLAENLPRLEWWVLDWNEPSIRFYRSIGAEPMEEWTVQRVSGEALARLGQ